MIFRRIRTVYINSKIYCLNETWRFKKKLFLSTVLVFLQFSQFILHYLNANPFDQLWMRRLISYRIWYRVVWQKLSITSRRDGSLYPEDRLHGVTPQITVIFHNQRLRTNHSCNHHHHHHHHNNNNNNIIIINKLERGCLLENLPVIIQYALLFHTRATRFMVIITMATELATPAEWLGYVWQLKNQVTAFGSLNL